MRIKTVLDIAANLVLHLKKGYGDGFPPHAPNQIAALETAFRYLGVSAKHFRVSFGNNGNAGVSDALYFTAGPNGESDGLFGSLVPALPKEKKIKTASDYT